MGEYHVFAGSDHYPKGGWDDHVQDYGDYDTALRAVANMAGIDWWQIVRIMDDGSAAMIDSGKRL